MKQILLFLVGILSSIVLNAQIKPPQQTDTLYISSVKYNYADIRQENWPCRVLYKSTTSFKIGDEEFKILEASKSGLFDEVEFVVTDKKGIERYILIYREVQENKISVIFSGYEFICRKVQKEEEKVEEAIPFQSVEEHPSFQGGDVNQFSKWVNQRLVYPEIAKENGIQGRVILQFTVEVDGSVTKVKVLRGVDPSLDKEAVRVVSISPKWKPGKLRGVDVPVTYTFPVIFKL